MSYTNTLQGNYRVFKRQLHFNSASTTIKIIIMDTAFEFRPLSQKVLSDVIAHQLPTGNGYEQNDRILTVTSSLENLDDITSTVTFDNESWGDSVGNFRYMLILLWNNINYLNSDIITCIDVGEERKTRVPEIFPTITINGQDYIGYINSLIAAGEICPGSERYAEFQEDMELYQLGEDDKLSKEALAEVIAGNARNREIYAPTPMEATPPKPYEEMAGSEHGCPE